MSTLQSYTTVKRNYFATSPKSLTTLSTNSGNLQPITKCSIRQDESHHALQHTWLAHKGTAALSKLVFQAVCDIYTLYTKFIVSHYVHAYPCKEQSQITDFKLHPLRTTDKYAKPVYLLDTPMTIKYSQVYDSSTSELTIKFK